MKPKCLLMVAAMLFSTIAGAQGFRPPPFAGGIPGRVQMQAIEMQRHQARTLLYREALEELKRNPKVVDVRECGAEVQVDATDVVARLRECQGGRLAHPGGGAQDQRPALAVVGHRSVASIVGKGQERAVASLFSPGGTHALKGEFAGASDFEVLAYLVVLAGPATPPPAPQA